MLNVVINKKRLVDMICNKMSDSLQDQTLASKNSANGGSSSQLNVKNTQKSACSC